MNCMVCNKALDYEPQMCCGGFECGCRGMPVDPPVCSDECHDKVMSSIGSGIAPRAKESE